MEPCIEEGANGYPASPRRACRSALRADNHQAEGLAVCSRGSRPQAATPGTGPVLDQSSLKGWAVVAVGIRISPSGCKRRMADPFRGSGGHAVRGLGMVTNPVHRRDSPDKPNTNPCPPV